MSHHPISIHHLAGPLVQFDVFTRRFVGFLFCISFNDDASVADYDNNSNNNNNNTYTVHENTLFIERFCGHLLVDNIVKEFLIFSSVSFWVAYMLI